MFKGSKRRRRGREWPDFSYPTLAFPFPMGQPAAVRPHQVVATKKTDSISVSVSLFSKSFFAFAFLIDTASVKCFLTSVGMKMHSNC